MNTTNQQHDATYTAGVAPAPAEAHQEAGTNGNSHIDCDAEGDCEDASVPCTACDGIGHTMGHTEDEGMGPVDCPVCKSEGWISRQLAELRADVLAKVEKDAAAGCGLLDVLWDSRCQAGYEAILTDTPNEQKHDVETFLRTRGYDPEGGEYEPAEGECSLTGIDENCCPCGRHP